MDSVKVVMYRIDSNVMFDVGVFVSMIGVFLFKGTMALGTVWGPSATSCAAKCADFVFITG